MYQKNKYLKHAEIHQQLVEWQTAYPELFSFEVIGKSYEQRDIWAVTLTDTTVRAPQEKPAYYIDANHHAGEVTGSAVAMYTVDFLLNGFMKGDERAVRLLTEYTFYVIPRIAVDGSELYLTTPNLLRSSVREYSPLIRKGTVPEDINGDGRILEMRVKSATGSYKISEHDSRLMIPRQPDDYAGDFYDLLPEGLIEDYDGVEIKPRRQKWGLDLNRNYPMNWRPEVRQPGAGPYPLSESETKSVADFILGHPNIAGIMSYHTSGGIILRPRCAYSDKEIPKLDSEFFKQIGLRGEELTGYPCWSIFENFTVNKERPTVGSFIGFTYDYLGIYTFATELWDMRGRAGLAKIDLEARIKQTIEDKEKDGLALLQWNDEQFDGKLFVDWTGFEHPQLGMVEIGGWEPKFGRQNPPSHLLEEECHKNMLFTLSHAEALPNLRWLKTECTPMGNGVYKVRIEFVNAGYMVTSGSEMAQKNKIADHILITMDPTVEVLNGFAEQERAFLPGFSKAQAEWLVKAGDCKTLTVTVQADRAGMLRHTFEL